MSKIIANHVLVIAGALSITKTNTIKSFIVSHYDVALAAALRPQHQVKQSIHYRLMSSDQAMPLIEVLHSKFSICIKAAVACCRCRVN